MAMTEGGSRNRPVTDVNVTPLIDVLLVLLIIFMVISPLKPSGLNAGIPQPQITDVHDAGTVVVSVGAGHNLSINRHPIAITALGPRLEDIFKTRNERVMFVKGDPDVSFGDVATVIDIARGAGVDRIGLMTKAFEEGS